MFIRFLSSRRLRFTSVHFLVSLLIIGATSGFVFGVLYPAPFDKLSGVSSVLILLILVDIVLGPLCTFIVCKEDKTSRQVGFDLTVIVCVQSLAFLIGVSSLYQGRPVYVAFEIDRLRVIYASDVENAVHTEAVGSLGGVFSMGPKFIAIRNFEGEEERMRYTLSALKGYPIALNSELWVSYGDMKKEILRAAMPVAEVVKKKPNYAAAIEYSLFPLKRLPGDFLMLPIIGRRSDFMALIDARTADVVGYVNVDYYLD